MRLLIFSIILLFSVWNIVCDAQRMTRYFVHLDNEGRITYSFTPGPSARTNLLLSSENFGSDTDSDMTLPPDSDSMIQKETTSTRGTTTVTETPLQDEYPNVLATVTQQQPRRAFNIHYRVKYVTKPPRIEVATVSPQGNSKYEVQAPRLILTNATGDFLAKKMKLLQSNDDLNSQIVPVEVSYKLVNGRKVFPEGYRPHNVFVRPIWKHPRLMTLPTAEPIRPEFTTEAPQRREFSASDRPTPQRVARPRFIVGHRADLRRILYKLRRPSPIVTTSPEPIQLETTTFFSASEAPITRLPFRFPPRVIERRGPYLVGFRVKRPGPQFILPTRKAATTWTPETTTTVTPTTKATVIPSTEATVTQAARTTVTQTSEATVTSSTEATVTQTPEATVTNVAGLRSSKSSSESSSAESRTEKQTKTRSSSSEEVQIRESEAVVEETTTMAVWPESSTAAAESETVPTTTEPATEIPTDITTIDTTTAEQETTVEVATSPEPTVAVTVATEEETKTTATVTPSAAGPIKAVPAAEITQEEQDSIDLNEIQNVIDTGFDTNNPNNEITNQVSEIWDLKKKLEKEDTEAMRTRILDAEQRLEDLFISLRRSRRRRMKAKMARS